MQELNTIFPYGLNNRIDILGIHDAHEHVKNGNAFIKPSRIILPVDDQVKISKNF